MFDFNLKVYQLRNLGSLPSWDFQSQLEKHIQKNNYQCITHTPEIDENDWHGSPTSQIFFLKFKDMKKVAKKMKLFVTNGDYFDEFEITLKADFRSLIKGK